MPMGKNLLDNEKRLCVLAYLCLFFLNLNSLS
jgi:hypothetical protein